MVNSYSPIEATETRAIGRALAALGVIGGEYASADELMKPTAQNLQAPTVPSDFSARMKPDKLNPVKVAEDSDQDKTWVDVAEIIEMGLGHQPTLADLNSYYKNNQPVIDEMAGIEPNLHGNLLAAFSNRKKELA